MASYPGQRKIACFPGPGYPFTCHYKYTSQRAHEEMRRHSHPSPPEDASSREKRKQGVSQRGSTYDKVGMFHFLSLSNIQQRGQLGMDANFINTRSRWGNSCQVCHSCAFQSPDEVLEEREQAGLHTKETGSQAISERYGTVIDE